MSVYNSNTIEIPVYDQGYFYLYKISRKGQFPKDYISKVYEDKFFFNYQSVGYKLKYDLKDRDIDVDTKIVLEECKIIDSSHVVCIENKFYHVLSAYHQINKNGFAETILTLEKYKNYILEDDNE